jgi:hypothetical protein
MNLATNTTLKEMCYSSKGHYVPACTRSAQPVARGRHVGRYTVLCWPLHSVMLAATQCYVDRYTVLRWPLHSVMLAATQCYVVCRNN